MLIIGKYWAHGIVPPKGKTEQDVKPGARTIIWPLTVWTTEPQWDCKDKYRSTNNQVALTAGVQPIHTYILTTISIHQQWHFEHHSQRQQEAFTNIGRYVHSLLLINSTEAENCTYRLAVHIRHSSQSTIYKAKLVIAPYSSASIDHASSFFLNLTKHKIYTYTQRSSLQL